MGGLNSAPASRARRGEPLSEEQPRRQPRDPVTPEPPGHGAAPTLSQLQLLAELAVPGLRTGPPQTPPGGSPSRPSPGSGTGTGEIKRFTMEPQPQKKSR